MDRSPMAAAPPPSDEDCHLSFGGVPPEELEGPPGLARLLRGLSGDLERGLQEAEAELALRRGAWLRWETLRRGLQELLRDPQRLEPPLLQALEQALALAEVRHGAPAFAPLLPPNKDRTPLRARLLPELERRLAEKVEELTSYHRGGAPQNPPGQRGGVAEALGAEQRRLCRARGRQWHLRQLLERDRRDCHQALGRCGALLGRLAGAGAALAAAAGRRAAYLEAKGTAMLLKTRMEELTLLLDTYPPDKLEAHRHIRAELGAAVRRAEQEAELARAGLAAFESCGPALAELAGEYGRLRHRLAHRRWALRQLRPHSPSASPVTSPVTSSSHQ